MHSILELNKIWWRTDIPEKPKVASQLLKRLNHLETGNIQQSLFAQPNENIAPCRLKFRLNMLA